MSDQPKNEPPLPRPRWADWLVIGLALAVLGGTLAWAALDLRTRIRAQIVRHDAEILDAVTLMQHLDDSVSGDTIGPLKDPGEQFQLALKVSRMRNVLGVRLYSGTGKFVNAFPAYITEYPLPPADLAVLQKLEPVSHFAARARMQDQDLLAKTNSPTAALLVVEVPLRADNQQQLAGVIQFLMDGRDIARQYADLDWNLVLKFSTAFVVGAAILITGLGFALRRVRRANQQLAERTANLLQANRELALAARTSAVGAVASHLIHGLRNPVSGLRQFVSIHQAENSSGSDTEWRTAVSTTQRMEDLINRIVRVLQEQQSGVEYEVSLAELAGLLAPKAKALAGATGVYFETQVLCPGKLSNREADLILLILENLVQNAFEATPTGGHVAVTVTGDAAAIQFEVRDQGPGLAPGQESRLFMPGPSGKKGGGGIGLAISRQLAHSLGARLELAASNATGCVFRLTLPVPAADLARPAIPTGFAYVPPR